MSKLTAQRSNRSAYLRNRNGKHTPENLSVRVAFVPSEIVPLPETVAVLVDVMRATTAIVHFLDRGVRQVILTTGVRRALREAARVPGSLLCGESRDGERLSGFDLAPSPTLIDRCELQHKTVVLKTSNGTVAASYLRRRGVGRIYIGSLNQRTAVARAALRAALKAGAHISIVCAGRERCRSIALDDAFAAGSIVTALARLNPCLQLHDSAILALALVERFAPMDAFRASGTWRVLSKTDVGTEDLQLCSKCDISTAVPMLKERDGRLVAVLDSRERGA